MYRKSEIEHLNLDKWSKIQFHNIQNLLLPLVSGLNHVVANMMTTEGLYGR